ncbi:MAG: hydrogenase [Candidatus Sumerlaeota bacterium]|nr:hydrogenase [Candidatus Sumerlaeota bacterium]
MSGWENGVMLLIVLTNLALLGSSRLRASIVLVAGQGLLLGALPCLISPGQVGPRLILVAGIAAALKGIVFPWIMRRARREAGVRREAQPYIGYNSSLIFGVAALAFSAWIGSRLTLPVPSPQPLIVPVSFMTMLTGLFIIITRKKALIQALGYLTMENGIYIFGVSIATEWPWLMELGILLDVFVAVFVMGIAIFHISREFDHIDTDRMASLHDRRRRVEEGA